jgi:hypothetical protein
VRHRLAVPPFLTNKPEDPGYPPCAGPGGSGPQAPGRRGLPHGRASATALASYTPRHTHLSWPRPCPPTAGRWCRHRHPQLAAPWPVPAGCTERLQHSVFWGPPCAPGWHRSHCNNHNPLQAPTGLMMGHEVALPNTGARGNPAAASLMRKKASQGGTAGAGRCGEPPWRTGRRARTPLAPIMLFTLAGNSRQPLRAERSPNRSSLHTSPNAVVAAAWRGAERDGTAIMARFAAAYYATLAGGKSSCLPRHSHTLLPPSRLPSSPCCTVEAADGAPRQRPGGPWSGQGG